MKYCVECGNELGDSAESCVNCETKVEQFDQEESTEVVESEKLEEPVGTTAENIAEAAASSLGKVSLEDAEHYFLEYLAFMKDILFAPSSIFAKGTEVWIFGLVNVVLYSIVLALNTYGKLLISFFQMFVLQVAFVVVLFVVNKFIIRGTDSIFDVLAKYGGLVGGQIVLFLLIRLLGAGSNFGNFLSLIASINQLLIFNTYIFENQTNEEPRVDNYYQLILSYIPFVIIMAFTINALQ